MGKTSSKAEAIAEKDLSNWKLLSRFREVLAEVTDNKVAHPSLEDPRRLLMASDYLCLFLFGLLNPVVRTMRGLCAATDLRRMQEEVCSRRVSLGSFSEIQQVLDPAVLQEVIEQLASQIGPVSTDPKLGNWQWMIQDGSLWSLLPRARWAIYGAGHHTRANNAARLHLSFHLLKEAPVEASVTEGRVCERSMWKERWQEGHAYIGDRYYSENYKLLTELTEKGCAYVLRIRERQCVFTVLEELPVTAEDREKGVVRQAWVRLGSTARYHTGPVRLVWINGPEQELILATNLDAKEFTGALISTLYKRRWQVELFFRWIKCIFACRHFLAEGRNGAAIQIYLALIASLLLQLSTGAKPTKRILERMQLYFLGIATEEELKRGLTQELERLKHPAQK